MTWILFAAGTAVLLVGLLPVLTPTRMVQGKGYHRASWLLAGVGVALLGWGWMLAGD